MSASSLLAVPPAAAGYQLLGALNELGWEITIQYAELVEIDVGFSDGPGPLRPTRVKSSDGIRITARRGEHTAVLECRSVAEGALELFEQLRWL